MKTQFWEKAGENGGGFRDDNYAAKVLKLLGLNAFHEMRNDFAISDDGF